jgi:hypothetical protein
MIGGKSGFYIQIVSNNNVQFVVKRIDNNEIFAKYNE